MLDELGFASRAALVDAAVPAAIRSADGLDLPEALSEEGVLAELRSLASKNVVKTPSSSARASTARTRPR